MQNTEEPIGQLVCQRCTNCCHWPGFVRLNPMEIARISQFLDLSEYEFIQKYTRLSPQRSSLALIDNEADGHCIFLSGKECTINAVKPDQCRDFPNFWRFPGWRELCCAIELEA